MIQELNIFEAVFKDALKTAFIHVDTEYIDDLLDKRDLPEFSDVWMKAYQPVEGNEITTEKEDKINDLRKDIFVFVFRSTGSSDLSAYISDDVGLICAYYIHNIENKWVTDLLYTYLTHQIPHGELMKTDQTIKELINSYHFNDEKL
ncbi:hypothetical protein MP478_15165 [Chryseobacterium sp. WG14]|uniref:hypothetical protein n=1 Tax=Chryseobacterium sp. WG14 TaxID=2926909 RepID=UPI00211E539D|nr:hypothetical protein [Chryseobacterium sp. WG14]MCQ9640726.1 hypothetical protein [Chryseobacterium sp. WG14]